MLADDVTLGQAREWLRKRVEEGDKCPCCTQLAKVYRRSITTSCARALIVCYRSAGSMRWFHMPTVRGRNDGDGAKLAYWGLLQEETAVRSDGGRSGWWRVTSKGESFVQHRVTVPKYARVYDGRVLGHLGKEVDILDCLGQKFNYAELMAA